MNSNKRLYWTIMLLAIGSYGWIGYNLSGEHPHSRSTSCLFKTVTGVPCPSCGITRSVLLLIERDFSGSFKMNPLGIVAIILLLIIPLWIITDLIRKKNNLFLAVRYSEKLVQSNKILYIPLVILMVANWIWNISKGL